jgi:DNA mismatch repair protein MutH
MHPPESAEELLSRCRRIAGFTLEELSYELAVSLPKDLKRDKGTVGQLLELALGASAGSKAEPDFPHLGIELKTIPIDSQGAPLESTYVCVAPMNGFALERFEDSWVYQKLSRVLWVPVLASRDIPLPQRTIGQAFLWQPNQDELAVLKQDWEELMELLRLGQLSQIKGQHGVALQLRPKGANSQALTNAFNEDGATVQALPRGFYLKTSFTRALLQRRFG